MGAPFLYVRAEMADCRRAGCAREQACCLHVRAGCARVRAQRACGFVACVSRLVACTCEQVVRVSSRVVAAERMDGA